MADGHPVTQRICGRGLARGRLTMYMGDPQRVAAIMLVWRYLAKPKSAGTKPGEDGRGRREER